MSRVLLLHFFLATAVITTPTRADDWRDSVAPPAPGTFPPPPPFKAIYRFGWSGISAAQADCDFTKAAGDIFQLDIKTRTTGFVRSLWRMDAEHKALCSAPGLRPLSLQQNELYRGESYATKADFSDEIVRWTSVKTPSKDPPPREHKFKCANSLDLQTAWLYVRSQRLHPGDHYQFIVFPGKNGYLIDIEVLGHEKIKVPPGSYDAIKCQARLQGISKNLELEQDKNFRRAFCWVSDDPQRLLLKVQADIFIGSVWCELQSFNVTPKSRRPSAITGSSGSETSQPGSPAADYSAKRDGPSLQGN